MQSNDTTASPPQHVGSTAELGDWEDVTTDQMPTNWGDECKRYRIVCSNGFVGPFGLESALLHKPALWPQCYQNGAEDSCCTVKAQRRRLPNTKLKDGHD